MTKYHNQFTYKNVEVEVEQLMHDDGQLYDNYDFTIYNERLHVEYNEEGFLNPDGAIEAAKKWVDKKQLIS